MGLLTLEPHHEEQHNGFTRLSQPELLNGLGAGRSSAPSHLNGNSSQGAEGLSPAALLDELEARAKVDPALLRALFGRFEMRERRLGGLPVRIRECLAVVEQLAEIPAWNRSQAEQAGALLLEAKQLLADLRYLYGPAPDADQCATLAAFEEWRALLGKAHAIMPRLSGE